MIEKDATDLDLIEKGEKIEDSYGSRREDLRKIYLPLLLSSSSFESKRERETRNGIRLSRVRRKEMKKRRREEGLYSAGEEMDGLADSLDAMWTVGRSG